MKVRSYGSAGPFVIVIHGGPGAPGSMAAVARGLEDSFRVLEPFQRGSGGDPLTVARHVQDLHELIASRCSGARPALVGSSWGAMLALAYAAEHPRNAGPLVLVGCGTFDRASRARFTAICDARMNEELQRERERLWEEIEDPDARLRALGDLLLPTYSYDLITTDVGDEECDARANHEAWEDMVRLQDLGVYPAAFAAIETPVLMLHGAVDPHPGRMIYESLKPHIPGLEFREWELCGHYPWLERAARDEFFDVLREWLTKNS